MEVDSKVFTSHIERDQKSETNNLYDLLNIVPAKPIQDVNKQISICDFEPTVGKNYIQKKKNTRKVKTVRDVRNLFEKDTYEYLSSDLEKQHTTLLRKIKYGTLRDESTKSIAKNILKCDKPVSRTAWQMVMNINPEGHPYSSQYVLWNGKRIQVNGSKGGTTKFLCKYDIGENKRLMKKSLCTKNVLRKKKGLLQNSLTVNFKPGPLSRKKYLDNSYQKYHVGDTELLRLPKIGLDIQPAYGVPLESSITQFLHSLRDVDGVISEKWSEFAVSTLGKLQNNKPVQMDKDCCVTFDLNYKFNQQRIIMRRDVKHDKKYITNEYDLNLRKEEDEAVVESEIKNIISNMLDSVEITLDQDNMYTGEDESRDRDQSLQINDNGNQLKVNRKRFCELDRLDVTVITLSENPQKDQSITCENSFCALGCICSSLQSAFNLKQHCGRVECMFECKCNFSKCKMADTFGIECSDLLPGLVNLDNEINSKLAKEEQKFHQTVIVSGEKRILLKSHKRSLKTPKKYADFFSNKSLQNDSKSQSVLSIVDVKLNCDNVEPWCMVHNLYKCFCKGKFVDSSHNSLSNTLIEKENSHVTQNKASEKENIIDLDGDSQEKPVEKVCSDTDSTNKDINRRQLRQTRKTEDVLLSPLLTFNSCARIRKYKGRKYSALYYKKTNLKIKDMEKNDTKLQIKLLNLIQASELHVDSRTNTSPVSSPSKCLKESLTKHEEKHTTENENPCTKSDSTEKTNENIKEQSITASKKQIGNNMADKVTTKSSVTITPFLNKIGHNYPSQSILADSVYKITTNSANVGGKNFSNDQKLVTWFESSYRQYKLRSDQGKTSLEAPSAGKMSLYPWEFILSRYSERKNFFLITKEKPYRIFMAVNIQNQFFENCINIDDIRFADLYKYPDTVKNLLTNAKDLKDCFCVLYGLSHCWEITGAVTKINTQKDDKPDKECPMDSECISSDTSTNEDATSNTPEHMISDSTQSDAKKSQINSDSSKWFVMTIENDFSEIQFYKKGFFVKYESILKAIRVARASGKTVRLSSQKCVDGTGPQFGIYAIPNANEYCVFVGPYELEEPLGIETMKSVFGAKKNRKTRGVWITTKKVDNLKVIDNPLSFIPANDESKEFVPLINDTSDAESNKSTPEKGKEVVQENKNLLSPEKDQLKKTVKPIRIRKTNGFYHLSSASPSIMKQLLPKLQQRETQNVSPMLINTSLLLNTDTNNMKSPLLDSSSSLLQNRTNKIISPSKRPVAEIAPQIKISNVYSECTSEPDTNKTESRRPEGKGMFILKPEEINKKLLDNKMFISDSNKTENDVKNNRKDPEVNMDIENFLATSVVCTVPNPDILVISDDEIEPSDRCREVYIQCKNIENLGWIPGRRNSEKHLSFQFPGFKSSEFYPETEAFTKINQVMARKVYVPTYIQMQWEAVESKEKLKTKQRLKNSDIGSDYVMTKRGPRYRFDMLKIKERCRGTAPTVRSLLKTETSVKISDEDSNAANENAEEEVPMIYS